MFLLFLLFSVLALSHSPMVISFSLVGFSLFVGQMVYQVTLSVFSLGALLLTFTSGMMILFCFCSMLVKHEGSVISHSAAFGVFPMMFLFLCSSVPVSLYQFLSDSLIFINSFILMMGLLFIMVSMLSINGVIFYPLKTFFYSY